MWQLILKNKSLFILYFFLVIGTLVFIIIEGKVNTFLLINRNHTLFFDSFFKLITNLGDGLFMVLIGFLLLIFVSLRYGFTLLSSFLCSSLIVQLLKRLVFSDFDRPVLFFKKSGLELYKIPGLDYYSHFSFPSGHSTTAFALFIGLALFTRNFSMKFLFLLLACITAFSRVYLSQHFPEDIIAGSVLGTLAALFMHFLFFRWKRDWLDTNLMKLIRIKND